ncbi:urease accessory protein UreF [Methyloceanibacter sp.]|uniref:urease accessory protein UreF n=1 Tax=Methyloceanibacter sp. TaxID=1965321 RepID=UPI003D6CB025
MSDVAQALAVLQFGDSFFPSGAVSFSWGLEGLSGSGAVTDADTVRAFVIGQLRARWAEFDRPVVVSAHRARMNLDNVAAIDDQVEVQSPCAELRGASRRMGDAMLSVFARLGIGDAAAYREKMKQGDAFGHLPAMQGYLWGGAGLSERDAVALSAHTFATGLLGAGIRLGCLGHIEAQQILVEARQEAARLAALPVPPVGALSAYGLEAEIAVMQHANNSLRVFAN